MRRTPFAAIMISIGVVVGTATALAVPALWAAPGVSGECKRWLTALLISTLGGAVFVLLLKSGIDKVIKAETEKPDQANTAEEKPPGRRRQRGATDKSSSYEDMFWSPLITGVLERGVFTVLVGLGISGVVGIAGPFIIAKTAVGWQRITQAEPGSPIRARSFRSLMCSLVSVAIGIVAGHICRGCKP